MYEDAYREIEDSAEDLCLEIAEEIATEANRLAPVGKTHRLKGSYKARRVSDGAEVTTDVEYWEYAEYGTHPHRISNAFGLGQTVDHPGSKAQPHVRVALHIVGQRRGL